MLKHLVDQQNFSATFLKLVGKVYDAMPREIEIVHVDEQTGTVGSEFLFGVLEKESGFSYATCPFDTNQTSLQSISSIRSRRTGALVCSTR